MSEPTIHQLMQNLWEAKTGGPDALDRFRLAYKSLFEGKLNPMREAFLHDAAGAMDEVLDFLEVDILAIRCGYEKERYFHKLKRVALTASQQQRLLDLALLLCGKSHCRRELWPLFKLILPFATAEFYRQLKLLAESDEPYVRQKCRRLLERLQEKRPDLLGS